jgi:hypothetical protein
MVIGGYFISGYCLFFYWGYWWLLMIILLVVILLMVINSYSISCYYKLNYRKLSMVIGGYSIDKYLWLLMTIIF